jgi:hypothetical protein
MVLLCDNPLIEKYLDMVLRRSGRDVMVLQSSRALEALKSGAHNFTLLITNSPADFRSVADRLPFLYLSAAPDPQIAATFPRIRVLEKPFRTIDLLAAVNELCAAS